MRVFEGGGGSGGDEGVVVVEELLPHQEQVVVELEDIENLQVQQLVILLVH